MSALAEVADVAARHDLVLRRAWPRSAEHLLLDLVPRSGGAGDGAAVAGQWSADPSHAGRTAARTGAPAVADGGVVLQPRGADRRLPALAGLVQQPGAALVAHRPERRAVVRRADGAYAKVVRPERVAGLVRSTCAAHGCGVRVPQVLDVHESHGVVTTAPLPGRTLHDLLRDGDSDVVAAAREVGRSLAALHASPLPPDAPVHDAEAELAVLRRWLALAAAHGVLPDGVALPDLGSSSAPRVPVHRDLHDKQVLVDDRGRVGLLDFDLAAAGEAALDLANLLVHLELRAEQDRCAPELARAAADAVLEGYAPTPGVLRRLPAYDAAARCRLVAVYGFRPASAAAARRLLGPIGDSAGMDLAGATP